MTTTDRTGQFISPSQIAQLARVQRPVVSAWRSRFAQSSTPFPSPQAHEKGTDLFDAHDVAAWLVDTGHGNNPDAVADAAAFTDPVAQAGQHEALVEALIALRVRVGEPLTGRDLDTLAVTHDRSDRALAAEITTRPKGTDWAAYLDALVDAAYSPEGAWKRRVAAARHRSNDGPAGALDADALHLLRLLVTQAMPPAMLDLACAGAPLADAATFRDLVDGPGEDTERCIALPTDGSARHAARYLLVHGHEPADTPTPASLVFARLPGLAPQAELAALEELVIELDEWQTALVLGPDTLLVDELAGPGEASRDALLRTGRVRAIARLPAGWVPAAPRHSLALWLVGGSQRAGGIAERISAIGDLRGTRLTHAGMRDLATDLSSMLGSITQVRGHAFRYLRVVRTSRLLAEGGSLVAHGALAAPLISAQPAPTELAAAVDAALATLRVSPAPAAPVTPVTATPGTQTLAVTAQQALDAKALRLLGGARLDPSDIAGAGTHDPDQTGRAAGYRVIGAAEVRGEGSERAIDPLRLAAAYPRAMLTEPGDVVFTAGSHPAALVDREGTSVVEYPARVLRAAPDGGLHPDVLAADVASQQPGSPWRGWQLRRVHANTAPALSEVLATLRAERRALEARAARIERAERLLVDAAAAGVQLAPQDPTVTLLTSHSPADEGTTHAAS
ncbi:hypothetical protein ACXR2W_12565 [Leucobacter sp. HY1908]